MPDLSRLQEWLGQFERLAAIDRLIGAMDPIAWTLLFLLVAAVIVGVIFTISTRFVFEKTDEVEVSPEMLLARLKQDPSQLKPSHIINRLGAEATLELLRYGDQITAAAWRAKWGGVREELLHLLSLQNAFAPIYALGRYYESEDSREPDSLRVRRTALIHKLGQRRHIDPAPDGSPAQLRLYRHPAEQIGDLGFDGPTHWLEMPDEDAEFSGPVVEMDQIDFHTVDRASVKLRIQRTQTVGGGFELELLKRRKIWIVGSETINWSM